MANDKPIITVAPVVEEPVAVAPVVDEKRAAKINAFLDEFAPNNHRRKALRDAIEDKTPVEGGAYFQARLKKIREVD